MKTRNNSGEAPRVSAFNKRANALAIAFFSVVIVLAFLPVLLVIMSALSSEASVSLYGYRFIPREFSLEAFRVTARLLAPGAPEKISIPVRIYSAEDDNQVISGDHAVITARMPKAERKIVPGSKHEIYRSPDAVLFPWWQEILDFFG